MAPVTIKAGMRGPGSGAPDNNVHDAVGQEACGELRDRERGKRGKLGGLEHHRVPCDERRPEPGTGEQRRVVERDHPSDDAPRLALRVMEAG